MTRWSAPLIFGALGVGFALGVLTTAWLDRRAAFRLPPTDEWSVTVDAPPALTAPIGPIEWRDPLGWTASDHQGLEHDLRLRPVWRP